jgi:hypothetical protein
MICLIDEDLEVIYGIYGPFNCSYDMKDYGLKAYLRESTTCGITDLH